MEKPKTVRIVRREKLTGCAIEINKLIATLPRSLHECEVLGDRLVIRPVRIKLK